MEVWSALPESQEGEHFISFDLRWSGADEVLTGLRGPSRVMAEADKTYLYQEELGERTFK